MVWIYYDESGEYGQDGALLNMSMGGCIAREERWASFSPNSPLTKSLRAESLDPSEHR
jgi:hypothetical protein